MLSLFPAKDPDARARKLQAVMRFAFGRMHDVLRALRILDFDRRAFQDTLPHEPCVLVANHPTLTDTSALFAVLENVASAVKPSVFRAFWARPLLAQAAHYEAPGNDPMGLRRVLDEAADRLARGYRVLLFPEGTRSPPGGPGPFGRAAFEIAVRARVPVVPLVIECEPRWLSKEHSFFDPPREVPKLTIRALPPIHPDEAGACSRTLRDMVSDAVHEALRVGASQGTDPTETKYAGLP